MTIRPPAVCAFLASAIAAACYAQGAASDAGGQWLQPYVTEARAAGWEPIAVDPATPTRYVDLARARDVTRRGDFYETSIREERSVAATLAVVGAPFAYLNTSGRWVVDCRGNRFTAIAQTWYRGNGLTGESHAESDASLEHWNPITPDSLGAIVRDWVCARGARP